MQIQSIMSLMGLGGDAGMPAMPAADPAFGLALISAESPPMILAPPGAPPPPMAMPLPEGMEGAEPNALPETVDLLNAKVSLPPDKIQALTELLGPPPESQTEAEFDVNALVAWLMPPATTTQLTPDLPEEVKLALNLLPAEAQAPVETGIRVYRDIDPVDRPVQFSNWQSILGAPVVESAALTGPTLGSEFIRILPRPGTIPSWVTENALPVEELELPVAVEPIWGRTLPVMEGIRAEVLQVWQGAALTAPGLRPVEIPDSIRRAVAEVAGEFTTIQAAPAPAMPSIEMAKAVETRFSSAAVVTTTEGVEMTTEALDHAIQEIPIGKIAPEMREIPIGRFDQPEEREIPIGKIAPEMREIPIGRFDQPEEREIPIGKIAPEMREIPIGRFDQPEEREIPIGKITPEMREIPIGRYDQLQEREIPIGRITPEMKGMAIGRFNLRSAEQDGVTIAQAEPEIPVNLIRKIDQVESEIPVASTGRPNQTDPASKVVPFGEVDLDLQVSLSKPELNQIPNGMGDQPEPEIRVIPTGNVEEGVETPSIQRDRTESEIRVIPTGKIEEAIVAIKPMLEADPQFKLTSTSQSDAAEGSDQSTQPDPEVKPAPTGKLDPQGQPTRQPSNETETVLPTETRISDPAIKTETPDIIDETPIGRGEIPIGRPEPKPFKEDSSSLIGGKRSVEFKVPVQSPVQSTLIQTDMAKLVDRELKPEKDEEPTAEVEATATPAEGRPTLNPVFRTALPKRELTEVENRQVTEKAAEAIRDLAAMRRPGRIVVRLNPEDLGTITIAIRTVGSKVDAEVSASSESVRQSLAQHRTELQQSVAAKGLSLNSLDVKQEGASWHQSGGQPGQQDKPDPRAMKQEFERLARQAKHMAPTRPAAARTSVLAAGMNYLA